MQRRPEARSSYSVLAQDWNGTGSFKSLARSLRYPLGGFQTPERSGLPSGNRGAGAERFGLPSGVRGIAAGRTFVHCPNAGKHIKTTVANGSLSFIGNSPISIKFHFLMTTSLTMFQVNSTNR